MCVFTYRQGLSPFSLSPPPFKQYHFKFRKEILNLVSFWTLVPNEPDVSAVTSFDVTESSIFVQGSSGAFAANGPGAGLDRVLFESSSPSGGVNSDGLLTLNADFNITSLPTAGTKYDLTFYGHITSCTGANSSSTAVIQNVCTRKFQKKNV